MILTVESLESRSLPTTLTVMAPPSVHPGEAFTAVIRVDELPQGLSAVNAEVGYDPARLALATVERGSLLESWPILDVNPQPGDVQMGVSTGQMVAAGTGGGLLALHFVALHPGTAWLSLIVDPTSASTHLFHGILSEPYMGVEVMGTEVRIEPTTLAVGGVEVKPGTTATVVVEVGPTSVAAGQVVLAYDARSFSPVEARVEGFLVSFNFSVSGQAIVTFYSDVPKPLKIELDFYVVESAALKTYSLSLVTATQPLAYGPVRTALYADGGATIPATFKDGWLKVVEG